jgi:adenine deaminase
MFAKAEVRILGQHVDNWQVLLKNKKDMKSSFKVSGNIVDVVNHRIFRGSIIVLDGKITDIIEGDSDSDVYIMPGFIDSHVHIESSMMRPAQFAKAAVTHGTVACVSDPHEIANVLGIPGVDFMIEDAQTVPFKFFFGAPSCVPATDFESSGAKIKAKDIETLLQNKHIYYLAEMMNFPGVIYNDSEVHKKIELAHRYNKPIDGHAPGLTGEHLEAYAKAGISTDHECMNSDEAYEKIEKGIKIQIREGSAAKNFDDLFEVALKMPEKVMFCSDDKHPDDLLQGHINLLFKRALEKGMNPIVAARICSYNPTKHYQLDVGLLQKGDSADFIVMDNFEDQNILFTYINGIKVAESGKSLIKVDEIINMPNIFNVLALDINDISIKAESSRIKVIEVEDGQLYTKIGIENAKIEDGHVVSDVDNDILKMVVLNRYMPSKPAIGFIKNMGLKSGAMASSIAHDSHNIVAVGTNDRDIIDAINAIIYEKGGISVSKNQATKTLGLPIAGLMSDKDISEVAMKYEEIHQETKMLGSSLRAPFMTLSFMSLLVIPELKLSDKGLFDGQKFELTNLFI